MFSETSALSSRKYVSELDISILHLPKKLQFFFTLLRFSFRKTTKKFEFS